MISPTTGPSGRHNYADGICLDEPGQPDFSESEAALTDVDEYLAKQHWQLAERFRELNGGGAYFNNRTSGVVHKIADWIGGAGVRREKFERNLEWALAHLERGEIAQRKGDWNQAYDAFQDARMRMEIAEGFWKDYITATFEGAESIVRGLEVVRNSCAALVAVGASALTLGAGTAMAGAYASSAGLHAGFFSLSFGRKEQTAVPDPPEIVTLLEIVDLDGQGGGQFSARPSQDAASTEDLPEKAPTVKTGTVSRRSKKRPASVSSGPPEEKVPPDLEIPLGEPDLIQKALEKIVQDSSDVQPNGPRVAVQNPTGTYLQYEDGGTLTRNPELGFYSLSKEAKVDKEISVASDGSVRGLKTKIKRKEKGIGMYYESEAIPVFVDHVVHNAGFGAGLSTGFGMENDSMRGGIADIVIAIDISKSMVGAVKLVAASLSKILMEMHLNGAKEVRLGVVVFRDRPAMSYPLYSDNPKYYSGIEVLENLERITPKRIMEIESNLAKLVFHGGSEPVGLAAKCSVALLDHLPETPEPHSRQVVIITDEEGFYTRCGDRYYPEEDQYASVRREAYKKGVTLSYFIVSKGMACGCFTPPCVQG